MIWKLRQEPPSTVRCFDWWMEALKLIPFLSIAVYTVLVVLVYIDNESGMFFYSGTNESRFIRINKKYCTHCLFTLCRTASHRQEQIRRVQWWYDKKKFPRSMFSHSCVGNPRVTIDWRQKSDLTSGSFRYNSKRETKMRQCTQKSVMSVATSRIHRFWIFHQRSDSINLILIIFIFLVLRSKRSYQVSMAL